MTESDMQSLATDVTKKINSVAGEYAAMMASLILKDTHPQHKKFTDQWTAMTPEDRLHYLNKDGKESCYKFIYKQFFSAFMQNIGEGWKNQLYDHLKEQIEFARYGTINGKHVEP